MSGELVCQHASMKKSSDASSWEKQDSGAAPR